MTLLLALLLGASVGTGEILLEAEDAEHIGVVVDTTRSGFSGTGYVTGFDEPGDSLRFRFEAEAGVYEIYLASAQSGRVQPYTIWIDGVPRTGALIGGGQFSERRLAETWLSAGPHTLVVQANLDVDYLRLAPVDYDPPSTPPVQLSDPEATPAAQALFALLKDRYGRQILSGQQELREVDYIAAVTGKEPAVAGGDLIEYSPSRWERGARPRRSTYAPVEEVIAWAAQDGIVALMWHWNAPTDLIDSADQPWWRGFYTEATTFDFAAALANPGSERYQLMLRDIDAIAVQLRKCEEADVPILWRPLHEAAGGWFWWGSKGPAPFVALWRLLYDRLVNHHGLHNLVWVYTHEPNAPDWYPGDDYVDVVSRDVYAADPAATMHSDWEQLQAYYGNRKLVALSESGTLPDPEIITGFGVWWSWFSIWNGSYLHDLDPDYLRRVYHSEHVLTRDELPAWRGNVVRTDPAVPSPAFALALYPNPSAGPANLRATLPAPADVRIEVFDLTGRRIHTEARGYHPAGTFETRVDLDAAAGVYLVRVVAGSHAAHRKLVVVR